MTESLSTAQPRQPLTAVPPQSMKSRLVKPLTGVTPNAPQIPVAGVQPPAQSPARPVLRTTVQSTPPAGGKVRRFLPKKWQKIAFGVLLVIVLIGSVTAAIGLYTLQVVQDLKLQATQVQATGKDAYEQFKAQNLVTTQQGVQKVADQLVQMRKTYRKLAFYNLIPFARSYYQDGEHGLNAADAGVAAALKSIHAVEPYADVLGFTGQGSFTGGTTEDRLKVVLQTLEKVTPVLGDVTTDVEKMQSELAQIDPNRYPETFQGRPLRSSLISAQDVAKGAKVALTDLRPVIEQLPAAAGADGKRKKYFILFQNDNELRPTGGFLTAYAIIYVENGKVTPDKSDDIYALDKKFTKRLPIPEKLGKYLTTEKFWNLRDMNIFPDFKTSMDQFVDNYKNVPDEPRDIDGIIAVDTHVLVDLLKVLGPVDVPGYGVFSAENSPKCDCPQIIYALSEIITKPTPYLRADRKGILGPMMRGILSKAYAAPKTQWPELVDIAWKNVQGRHAQFYFFDPKLQEAAAAVHAAGLLQADPNAEDFLAVIDANLGGAKSNLFITSDVKQEVSPPANGTIDKKVIITYKNSRPGDNCNLEAGLLCLNATLRDWNRIYLPKGAVLKNSKGYITNTVRQYDEDAFTVVDGEFSLQPNSTSKLELEYTVPYNDTKEYKVKIWKQGGIDQIPFLMNTNGNEEQITVTEDTIYTAKW